MEIWNREKEIRDYSYNKYYRRILDALICVLSMQIHALCTKQPSFKNFEFNRNEENGIHNNCGYKGAFSNKISSYQLKLSYYIG